LINKMKILLSLLISAIVFSPIVGGSNDERCSCKCPETFWVDPSIDTDFPGRKIYINSTVSASDCDCEHVVQPVLQLDEEQVEKMCPRCQCRHEERSTITIKVVVILILWVLCILVIYLCYLLCLDPLFKGKPIQVRRGGDLPYQQQQDNDESIDNDVTATPLRSYQGNSMVNRLGREQDRWKRQLEIQRSSVYDRHTMLN